MQALDRAAMTETGIPGLLLMENAGRGCAERILKEVSSELLDRGVTVVAGPGNNGGDGFVIARHLFTRGVRCRIITLAPDEKFSGDALANLEIIRKYPLDFHSCGDEGSTEKACGMLAGSQGGGLIVDAIFGTGLARDITGRFASVIMAINSSQAQVMAVDMPSGISADTGQVLGVAVMADFTVTMAMAKRGHFLFPGRTHTGRLHVTDIGIISELVDAAGIKARLFQQDDFTSLVKKRPLNGHKGTFGHLLSIAGSAGKSGAAGLVSAGALRSGAGLVTAATPLSARTELAACFMEHMTEPLPETASGTPSLAAWDIIMELSGGKRAAVAGPGLGLEPETIELARRIASDLPLPLVADADLLTAVGTDSRLFRNAPAPRILTPHPGEMSRLTGLSVAEIEADRVEVARELAARTNSFVVLKGAGTVCAAPDGRISLNTTGNPGMAAGGMGDVLAGIAGGLLAQGYEPWDAARMSVFAHGRAGDILYKIRGNSPGFLASELAENLRFQTDSFLADI
jgi:NAD(P)H-hydrate epimerase